MARMSDKEFALKFELRQLQQDRNRLERIKERTDNDLSETRQRIKVLKNQIDKLSKPKPKKKKAAAPKPKPAVKKEEKIEEVKVDASSMTAVEDSVELKDKKPAAKSTKAKESEKTDPA